MSQCDGYLDLGMCDQARILLHQVPESLRDYTAYRELRARLAILEEDWAMATMLSRTLQGREPEEANHWLRLAFSLRRFMDIETAKPVLQQAMGKFPDIPEIPFNLACYECQQGDPAKAMYYIRRAMGLNPSVRKAALDDRDLEPIWEHIYSEKCSL